MYNPRTYTVESVTLGHPDKICDQISDAILDAYLAQDPKSRVAVETFGCHGNLIIGGEVTSRAEVDAEKIARDVYKSIGHEDNLDVTVRIVRQSPDISMGVDTGGAGDQGIMYGFATDETKEFLPLGVVVAHKLAKGLEDLRKRGDISWLKPDGKTQVTVTDGKIDTILVSAQHEGNVSQEEIRKTLIEKLIIPIVGRETAERAKILVNPTGKFEIGGFTADTGLTGRKIIVDTYGGLVPHGGGCFSGKDPTKVDRSGAYMARWAAKNIVAKGLAKKCLVSVSYAIGKAEPLMICAVNEDGKDISELARMCDFSPLGIIKKLNLRRPIYQKTAAYGHFGKAGLPWEEVG